MSTRALQLLALMIVAMLSLAIVACGGGASTEGVDTAATTVGEQPADDPASEEELQEVEQQVQKQGVEGPGKSGGGKASEDLGGIHCGGGLSVGPNTSCPFAHNVRSSYELSGGRRHISAYSPVTGETYVMDCGPGADVAVVCTGGDNATVYFN